MKEPGTRRWWWSTPLAVLAVVVVGCAGWAGWTRFGLGAGSGQGALRPRVVGHYTPRAGSTVGAGMIVSVVFDEPVADRSAVRRAISVVARPAVPVAGGHWFGDRRLDFRPERYWTPGTRVGPAAAVARGGGVPGRYGVRDGDISSGSAGTRSARWTPPATR